MSTQTYQTGTLPGVDFSAPGEVAAPNYSGIGRPGSYGRSAGALPGTAPANNIPTTYTQRGMGDVQTPYKTVDVPAQRVNEKQLPGTKSPYQQIPAKTPTGYLPPSSSPKFPGSNPSTGSFPRSTPGTGFKFPSFPSISPNLIRVAGNAALGTSAVLDFGSRLAGGESLGRAAIGTGLTLGGGILGANLGAALGTLILPGVGTFIGAGAGSVIGSSLGNLLGRKIFNWFDPKRYRDPKPQPDLPPENSTGGKQPGVVYIVSFAYSYDGLPGGSSSGSISLFGPIGGISHSAGPDNRDRAYILNGDAPFNIYFDAPQGATAVITGIRRQDGQPDVDPAPGLDPNRISFPDPLPPIVVDPGVDDEPQPEPQTQQAPAPAPAPAPYPFPEYPDLPNPNRAPAPTQNPDNAPSDAPAPAPLNQPSPSSPGQNSPLNAPLRAPDINPSPSPSTNPAPNPDPKLNPDPAPAPDPNPSLDPKTRQFDQPNTPTETPTTTPEKCKDPCIQGLSDKADDAAKKNEPVSITIKVFKQCKADGTGAEFEDKTLKVPKQESDTYKLLYSRIAKLEALQCNPSSAIAAVPEWWQLRPEAQRPQLVILYAEVLSTGKLTTSRWSLSLPHYNRPKGYKPNFPGYTKGNYEGILVLTDNSKVIVNANSMTECKRVLNSLKINIPAQYRTKDGKAIKAKVGERVNGDFKRCRVVPIRADFFSTGMRNLEPDWSITLRK